MVDLVQNTVPHFLPDVLSILHVHFLDKDPQEKKKKKGYASNFNYQFKNAVLYPECFTSRLLWFLISVMLRKIKHIQELENIPDIQPIFKRKNTAHS